MNTPAPHRPLYTREFQELERNMLEMATRADTMVGEALVALRTMDTKAAFAVMNADDAVDRLDLAIEAQCLRLLALQQPIGGDLREIGSVMRIIVDVERVADLAVDLAKIVLKIDQELGTTGIVDLERVGALSRTMVNTAMQAFARRDGSVAAEIVIQEDEADRLYRELRGQVHAYMRAHPDQVVSASWMLLALHHIERISDHALNIAERVVFMVTGEVETHHHIHTAAVREGTA